jgi:hypothetical protein
MVTANFDDNCSHATLTYETSAISKVYCIIEKVAAPGTYPSVNRALSSENLIRFQGASPRYPVIFLPSDRDWFPSKRRISIFVCYQVPSLVPRPSLKSLSGHEVPVIIYPSHLFTLFFLPLSARCFAKTLLIYYFFYTFFLPLMKVFTLSETGEKWNLIKLDK